MYLLFTTDNSRSSVGFLIHYESKSGISQIDLYLILKKTMHLENEETKGNKTNSVVTFVEEQIMFTLCCTDR